ncbi:hypothetical protein SKAU_G00250000 [Synaphobranchus kaupii]|uniref:Rootletin-like coiled-coil domain-containing protein n=1 Tax=Synaphobranchus kaupii TaxID=118154 RepID=A0A9Q1F2W3_SYNKA|nr:hypothetical protein SKAU_G00250000 [Synaphobranchus kaupii]
MEESEVANALIAYTRLADVVGEAEHNEIHCCAQELFFTAVSLRNRVFHLRLKEAWMEADFLMHWQDERTDMRAELSRLQDELAESCAEKEELRSRAQALTDRLAQSLDPTMSARQDSEQRDWKRKLREGREREARQAQLIQKLQSKVLEYRARFQSLEHQLINEERGLQKREKRIRNEHSNSLESALIRLEEEQQRSVGMAEMNALLRKPWRRRGRKDNEWQKEKELLTNHIGREHTRLISLWGGVVTLRRHYHTLRTATDRDLWELRAEFSRLSASLLSSCGSIGSSHAFGLGTGHAPQFCGLLPNPAHLPQPRVGSPFPAGPRVQPEEEGARITGAEVQHSTENQQLLDRISELSSSLQAQERERRRQEEEEERMRQKEKERERDWEQHTEIERDLQSVQQAVLNLANFLSSRQLAVRSSTPMSLADLSSDRLPSLLTIIAQAETALQCRHEELQEAEVRILRLEADREALEQQIRVLQKDGAELQEWALQGGQELRRTQELLQSEKETAVSLSSQLREVERHEEELRKENEHLRRQRDREEEERRELERDRQRRVEAGFLETAQLIERVEQSRQELKSLQGALDSEKLEHERAVGEAADARDALLKAHESVLALSSSQTQLKREVAESRDSLEKMAALNEALTADKRELGAHTLQLETKLADAMSHLQTMRSEVTVIQRELKGVSQEATELRAQRSAEMQSLQQMGDREKDLEREVKALKEEREMEISLLTEARERDAQKLEELSRLHCAVCVELRGVQAELCRAVEQQKRAEREKDDLLRRGSDWREACGR